MVKRMLIDAAHPEETRVAIMDDAKLLEYEGESQSRRTLKGNIYLAKVVRIEPSLQAAFVDYGGERHGFLPFMEIHPDYFRIPVSDREKLLQQEREALQREEQDEAITESRQKEATASPSDQDDDGQDIGAKGPEAREDDARDEAVDDTMDETADEADVKDVRRHMRPKSLHRTYKIQEVIHKNQIVLIQVVKEVRGNKGASLTTYLSLPGRYCVLMPNALRSAGISRKITSHADRQRLRAIIQEAQLPETMGAIIRTAGLSRSKTEIKRDLTYLLKLWSQIREETLSSVAPKLIYEEGDILQRAMRDMYTHDMEEILIEGKDAYKRAKDLLKNLVPSHAKRVQNVTDQVPSVFHTYNVHPQVDAIYDPVVALPSGGYLVMNITEALIAIDVNSGKATKDRHIEETAVRTNLEAADEVARQLRLRDMAGIVVIDFIDMSDNRNINAVERRFREAIKNDRARIQVGHISPFGLLELSRQRLRPSVVETASVRCAHCEGSGLTRSVESSSMQALRALEAKAASLSPGDAPPPHDKASDETPDIDASPAPGTSRESNALTLFVPREVAYYLLNQKRRELGYVESKYTVMVNIQEDPDLRSYHYRLLTSEEVATYTDQVDKWQKSKMESVEKSMNLTRPSSSKKRDQDKERGDRSTRAKGDRQKRRGSSPATDTGGAKDHPSRTRQPMGHVKDKAKEKDKESNAPSIPPEEPTPSDTPPSTPSSGKDGSSGAVPDTQIREESRQRRRSRRRRGDRRNPRPEGTLPDRGGDDDTPGNGPKSGSKEPVFVVHDEPENTQSTSLDTPPQPSSSTKPRPKRSRRPQRGQRAGTSTSEGQPGGEPDKREVKQPEEPSEQPAAPVKSRRSGGASSTATKAPEARDASQGTPSATGFRPSGTGSSPVRGRHKKGWLSRLLDT